MFASRTSYVLLLTLLAGCSKSKADEPAAPLPVTLPAPLRGAVGDTDLRVLLGELAAARACEMVRGKFRALRAPDRPNISTGILWIRGCRITSDGTKVTVHLTGGGWEWAEAKKKKAGGTFAIRQYVRFAIDTTIAGALDIAYDRKTHVASLWFSPDGEPEVTFKPLGDIDVDAQGVWSSVVSVVGTTVGSSPDEKAAGEAKTQGELEFKKQLGGGLSMTANLCTGLTRFNLGRPARGSMVAPDVGETQRIPVELQPAGMMVLGPYLAKRGMSIDVKVATGAVRIAMVCADDGELLAKAFLEEQDLPVVPLLATKDVRGSASLKIGRQACEVLVVARSIPTADGQPATFSWQRPLAEAARSTGGPLIDCGDSEPKAAPRKSAP